MSVQGQYQFTDDTQPSISYAGGWDHAEVPPEYQALNDTVSYATAAGATASYGFTSQSGIQFAAFCVTIFPSDNDSVKVNFTLDGGTPFPYSPTLSVNATDDGCYLSPTLSGGIEHELVVEVISGTARFGLDAFALVGNVTTGGSPPSPSSASSHKSSTNVGAIVGGVVGGVALLVASLLAVYFIWWRRRSNKPYFFGSGSPEDMLGPEEKVTPFTTPQPPSGVIPALPTSPTDIVQSRSSTLYAGGVGTSFANASSGTSSYAPAPGLMMEGSRASTAYTIANNVPGSSSAGPSSGLVPAQNLTPGQRKAMEAGVRTTLLPQEIQQEAPHEVQQYADSGVRFVPPPNPIEEIQETSPPLDVPPVYSES